MGGGKDRVKNTLPHQSPGSTGFPRFIVASSFAPYIRCCVVVYFLACLLETSGEEGLRGAGGEVEGMNGKIRMRTSGRWSRGGWMLHLIPLTSLLVRFSYADTPQQALNRILIHTVTNDDTPAAIRALDNSADPNSRVYPAYFYDFSVPAPPVLVKAAEHGNLPIMKALVDHGGLAFPPPASGARLFSGGQRNTLPGGCS